MVTFVLITVLATIVGGLVGGLSGGMYRLQNGGAVLVRGSFVSRFVAIVLAVAVGVFTPLSFWSCVLAALVSAYLSVLVGRYVNNRKKGL